MAASVDLNQRSLYLLNKYFIQPVLSLNTSVTNLDSTVTTFNNSLSVLANASAITRLNASTLANTSSITRLNTSVTTLNTSVSNLSNYVTNLNTSLSNAIDTVNSTTLTIGGTNGTSTQSYGSALSSGTLNIANSQTNGILNIGTGNNVVRSGAINIATVAGSTCPINILKSDGATTGGSVNIANGALQTTTVNIASGTGTGTVTIGNISNTTTLDSATINVNGNLIMGTGRNITLQPPAGYVAPSSNTQLGFSAGLPGISFSSLATNGNTTYCYSPPNGTVQNFLVAGVYLMSGYAFAYFSGTVSACSIQMDIAIVGGSATPSGTGAANGLFNTRIAPQINTPTGDTRTYFPTYTFTVVTHQYYYISCGVYSASITGGGAVTAGCQLLSLVRIA